MVDRYNQTWMLFDGSLYAGIMLIIASQGIQLRQLVLVSFAVSGFAMIALLQNPVAHLQDIGFPVAVSASALGTAGFSMRSGIGIRVCDRRAAGQLHAGHRAPVSACRGNQYPCAYPGEPGNSALDGCRDAGAGRLRGADHQGTFRSSLLAEDIQVHLSVQDLRQLIGTAVCRAPPGR